MSLIQVAGDFKLYNFAENHIKAYLKDDIKTSRYVTLTAATEAKKQLHIPFPHRLIKMVCRHTSNANVDANNMMDVQIRRDAGNIGDVPLAKEILFSQDDVAIPVFTIKFPTGFEYEETMWTLVFIGSTTGDRVHPVVYLQRLGKVGRDIWQHLR